MLLVHYLFYYAPLKCHSVIQRYPDEVSFRAHLEDVFYLFSFDAKKQGIFYTRLKSFDQERIVATLSRLGGGVVFLDDTRFPDALRSLEDCPLVLYYIGDLDLVNDPLLAFVGPRKPSQYGCDVTALLVKEVSSYFVTVSGMVAGIDRVAHLTALDLGCPSIAVVGTGLDTVYPVSNQDVFDRLIHDGLVLSEFPLGVDVKAFHFPQRNRIVSGLSQGVVVCEAGQKSGALITARFSLEQGRDVFAVPGSVFSSDTVGVHALIQDGAKLVRNGQDILEDLQFQALPLSSSHKNPVRTLDLGSLSEKEKCVFQGMSDQPMTVDDIVLFSDLDLHVVLQVLTLLSFKSFVKQLPGSLYQKSVS